MWPFKKNKFKKLKQQDVQDAIYQLEKQEMLVEHTLVEKQEEIEHYLKKGKREKSEEVRLLYAKKIAHLKEEMQADIAKGSYLLYNIKLLKKLKQAIQDKEFFAKTGKISLGNLLYDQKGLATFLNQALNTKVIAEDVLTSADETFKEIQETYQPSSDIYGVGKSEDEILSVFDQFEEGELEMPDQSPDTQTAQQQAKPEKQAIANSEEN